MARGTTLGELVTQLRNEVGDSINAGVSIETNARYRNILKRTQEQLYDDYDWPHMRVYRDVATAAGQRYYDFPTSLNVERVEKIEYYFSGFWYDCQYGIGAPQYNVFKSDITQATAYFDITGGSAGGGNTISSVKVNGVEILVAAVSWATSNNATAAAVAAQINSVTTYPQYTAVASGNRITLSASAIDGSSANNRTIAVTANGTVTASTPTAFTGGISPQKSDPSERWQIFDNGNVPQIELWPVPASTSSIRIWGIRSLRALVADADVADLDDTLIVLSAAAELTSGKPVSQEKLRKAQARMMRLKGNLSKKRPFVFGESQIDRPRPRTVVVKVAGT